MTCKQTHPFILISCLLLLMAALPQISLAQQEGQAVEEVMIFQQTDRPNSRPWEMQVGDRIKYPQAVDRRIRDETGWVKALGDSVIVVRNQKGVERIVDLRETPYIKVVRKRSRRAGMVLTFIGLAVVALTIAVAGVALSLGGGAPVLGLVILTILLSAFTNYFLLIGVPLWATAVKRLWLDRWAFRKTARVRVRRKGKQKQPGPVRKVVPAPER